MKFIRLASALLLVPLISSAESTEPYIHPKDAPLVSLDVSQVDVALARAPVLREQAMAHIHASRQRSPQDFPQLVALLDKQVSRFDVDALPKLNMAAISDAKWNGYNPQVWRLAGVADDLHAMAVASVLDESRYHDNAKLRAEFQAGVQWLLMHFSPQATTLAPDPNLDRFIIPDFFDAVMLGWPMLDKSTQEDLVRFFWQASYTQQVSHGRDDSIGGIYASKQYPNMDTAYALILRQVGELFDDDALREESALWTRHTAETFNGFNYDYIKGWPGQAGYTNIVLNYQGRYWQLSQDEVALKQLQRTEGYYYWFLEPSGILDFGSAPYLKRSWNMGPYSRANSNLELVSCVAPDSRLQERVKAMRQEAIETGNTNLVPPLSFYWLSATDGQQEPFPTDFLRQADTISGWQMRQTTPLGTWTAYLNGREVQQDSRVSAIATPANGLDPTALSCIIMEIIQDGRSYYLGDMEPEITLEALPGQDEVTMTVRQFRHKLGTIRPAFFHKLHLSGQLEGDQIWGGGSKSTAPVETLESWTMGQGYLDGEITLTAQQGCILDEIKLTAAPAVEHVDEMEIEGQSVFARYGTLCVEVTALTDNWKPYVEQQVASDESYNFQMDIPNGQYQVTLVSGDADYPATAFEVIANGSSTGMTDETEAGAYAEHTFRTIVRDDSLALSFVTPGNEHWKVNSLVVRNVKDGSLVKAFDVGPASVQPASGYERLSGGMVYATGKQSFGWADNYTSQERNRNKGGEIESTLITSNDPGKTPSPLVILSTRSDNSGASIDAEPGTVWEAQVRVRQAASLNDFKRLP